MRTEDIIKLIKIGKQVVRPVDHESIFYIKKAIILNNIVEWNVMSFASSTFEDTFYFPTKEERDDMLNILLQDENIILD